MRCVRQRVGDVVGTLKRQKPAISDRLLRSAPLRRRRCVVEARGYSGLNQTPHATTASGRCKRGASGRCHPLNVDGGQHGRGLNARGALKDPTASCEGLAPLVTDQTLTPIIGG